MKNEVTPGVRCNNKNFMLYEVKVGSFDSWQVKAMKEKWLLTKLHFPLDTIKLVAGERASPE